MTIHHLIAFFIVAAMVVTCAKLHMTDQQFNGVLQLGGTMVGVVGGVAVGIRMANKPDGKPGNGNGNGDGK